MKLQLAKGVRDFFPEDKILRQDVVDTLRSSFELYGFNPLETPIIERFETLSAKFGAGATSDIMKEIFRVKDQGNRELGLRFELTTSFARFIGMNPQLKMPFKRYEIGRVFRDGPIKLGRYREFWQCDVDIVGTKSMIADAEVLAIVDDVFSKLDLDVVIKVNNRKILNGILESAEISQSKFEEVIIIIDKLEKIGLIEVKKELKKLGLKKESIEKLDSFLGIKGDNSQVLKELKKQLDNEIGKEGLVELGELFDYLSGFSVKVNFVPSLARGLAYYTGTVFEVFLKDSKIKGSVAGGGRWDKMIGNFLGRGEFPAVGIAFGLEPITEALKLNGKHLKKSVVDLFILPIKTVNECLELSQKLRKEGINTEVSFIKKGISKALNYTNTLGIPYVLIIGPDELKKNKFKLKDMNSGKESSLTFNQLVKFLKK